jgi:SOS-response transcriptional repressor LexA
MTTNERRNSIRAWIAGIERRYNVSRVEVANRARIAPSTIYRIFDDKVSFEPSGRTIGQIAEAFGEAAPGATTTAQPYFAEDVQDVFDSDIPEAMKSLPPNQFIRVVTTRALELAGIMPGDILLVDMSVEPASDRIVIAQAYNIQRSTAETKLRLFEPPYLTTRTMDRNVSEKPLYVDREQVCIVGTVIRLLRRFDA